MTRNASMARGLRVVTRFSVAALALVVSMIVGVQFARIIDQNIAMARELGAANQDVAGLQARKRQQMRDVHRLVDPAGAIPEIHDRLRLVRPNEAIIFLKPVPRASSIP
jgi:hypothetical protein